MDVSLFLHCEYKCWILYKTWMTRLLIWYVAVSTKRFLGFKLRTWSKKQHTNVMLKCVFSPVQSAQCHLSSLQLIFKVGNSCLKLPNLFLKSVKWYKIVRILSEVLMTYRNDKSSCGSSYLTCMCLRKYFVYALIGTIYSQVSNMTY